MAITGTIRARCPGCGTERDCELVQSINTRDNPKAKAKLLAGELNVLACECGRRVQLAANLLYVDPDADYYCHVCPGDEDAHAEAAAAFAASGVAGTRRIVPSLNALVEKIKLLEEKLADGAIEMAKVLLLATIGELDRVLLFDTVDREAGVIKWVLFDEEGEAAEHVSSPLAAYTRILGHDDASPGETEFEIDRLWAVDAVKAMIDKGN